MDDRIDGKALHEPTKLLVGKLAQILGTTRPGKMAGSNSLVEEQESITFPQESLDACG